jgi:hypothetical protein
MRQPDNPWLASSKVQAQIKRLDAILARRDNLVKVMVTKAESDAGRAGLMAGGIVARLTTEAGQGQIKAMRPEVWVAAELKLMRATLARLNDEYTMASPARQIEIRNEILKTGLPGDPILPRMWSFRDAVTSNPPKPTP